MSEFDVEVQTSDLLTCYIQHFKNILSTKLSLVESLCLSSTSLQNNPQFLLSRLSNKTFKSDWKIDPFSITISEENASIIQRFYLRIQEYLEYRLGTLSTFNESSFNKELETFQKQLQKAIRNCHGNPNGPSTLGHLFQQLNTLESGFITRLLDILTKKKSLNTKGLLDLESLDQVKKFIDSKISKEENLGLRDITKFQEITISREHRFSLPSKTQERGNFKYIGRKKLTAKIQLALPSYLNVNGLLTPSLSTYQQQKSLWKDKESTPEDMSQEDLQRYMKQENKAKLNRAYSIMQIDDAVMLPNRDLIMLELQNKNLKNKQMIQTYLHRYEKKQRKQAKRNQAERISKSLSKNIKTTTKTDESNFFKDRPEIKQILTPSIKSSDPLKRIQGIELPTIASRHNRRTTVEK